jgi:hypothetical protein
MFDNLLYIFSKDTIDVSKSIRNIDNNYYVREVDKLNNVLLQKNSELQLLQSKYNKLLNHCINNELVSKLNNKKRTESIIIQDIQDIQDSAKAIDDSLNSDRKTQYDKKDKVYIYENNRDISDNDEYEKV